MCFMITPDLAIDRVRQPNLSRIALSAACLQLNYMDSLPKTFMTAIVMMRTAKPVPSMYFSCDEDVKWTEQRMTLVLGNFLISPACHVHGLISFFSRSSTTVTNGHHGGHHDFLSRPPDRTFRPKSHPGNIPSECLNVNFCSFHLFTALLGRLVGWNRTRPMLFDIPFTRQNQVARKALFRRLPRHCSMVNDAWDGYPLAD